MSIQAALTNVQRLGIETAPFIYYVENNPDYVDKMDAIIDIADTSGIQIIVSVITLTEILVTPLKAEDQELVDAYHALLTQPDNVSLIEVTFEIASRAADLRARYNLRTPDALHLATAINSGCHGFLTKDFGLKRVQEITVLVLGELTLANGDESLRADDLSPDSE